MTTSGHFSTQAVHAGNDAPAPEGNPISPSIYPAVTYTYDHMDDLSAALHENAGYSYSRYGSPTIAMLEQAVATLEGAEDAVAYASGMGALHGPSNGLWLVDQVTEILPDQVIELLGWDEASRTLFC